jgi:Ca-activated chloride channel family protein
MRLILAATAAATSLLVDVQQRPTFRAGIDTVEVYATVRHRDGRLVPNLPREEFQLLSDGKPVELTIFSNEIKTITVVVIVDTSGSTSYQVLWYRDSALHFIEALQGEDRARIVSFGHEIAVSPHLTGDKQILRRVLRDEIWPGEFSGTPLWVAINEGMNAMAAEAGRRVALVLSDGLENMSKMLDPAASEGDTRERAIDAGFMVYAMSTGNLGIGSALKGLADDTGGGYRHVERGADLKETMRQVAEELRHQYMLGFTPTALDDKRHRLEVRMKSKDLRARAPREYVARARAR